MAIECINTIEIQLPVLRSSDFSESVQMHILRLQESPGCHDYVLAPSSQDESRWWLSGYWESKAMMDRSFQGESMAELLNDLIQNGASLSFRSFVPRMAKPNDD